MKALREVGYQGDFTYELVYDRFPKALAPDCVALLYKFGEKILCEVIDNLPIGGGDIPFF